MGAGDALFRLQGHIPNIERELEFDCYFWKKHCRLEMDRICVLDVVGRSR
jgi:hypothetical protein